ncbi:MAG: putative DNA binding domain-containing protein, partial [Propionibacteriaceae bacterium]|nr:putative DNA binding domain-containing protein [Propionibacteriaceae bacterium]
MLDASEVKSLAKGGETLTVEFKQDSNDHPIHSSTLLRAVVGLSNNDAGGGTLLVGVDNDGTISGIGSRSTNLQHRDGARLSAYLRNKTTPPVAVEAGFVDIDEATVAVIRVGQPDEPVGSEGLYVRRRLKQDGTPEVIPYSLPEMANRRRLFFDQDYAGVPIPAATLDDLDHGEFDKYRARAARGPEPNLAELNDSELLRALGLGVFDSDAIVTAGALLLFGRPSSIERHLPTAEVVFSALQGTLLASSEIGYWPLLSAADHLVAQVMDALRRRAAPEAELTIGAQRVSLPAITNATLREAVANALVHRDYAMAGATTVVVSDDGCQITNPGGLPKGVSLANMMEETRPRSRLLADGFKRAGYVERTGRGVPLMYMDQIRNGQAAPDYSGTTGDQVCVQFRATRADIEM